MEKAASRDKVSKENETSTEATEAKSEHLTESEIKSLTGPSP